MIKNIVVLLTLLIFNTNFYSQKGDYIKKSIIQLNTEITISKLNTTQLTNYNKILKHNIYSKISFINIGDIKTNSDSGVIKLDIPQLTINNLLIEANRVDYTNSKNFNWTGMTNNEINTSTSTYANLTLMKNDGNFIGHLSIENRSLEIFDLTDGVQVICETDIKGLGNKDCAVHRIQTPTGPSNTNDAGDACKDLITKVLVLYTPAAFSNEPDIIGRANLCISQINQNWQNSYILNSLTIASVQLLNFTESGGDISIDVDALSNNTTAQALRNQYKAEVVVLLTSNVYNAYGVVKEVQASKNNAYSIVNIETSTTSRYTFAHEVSHLFGARHDDDATNDHKGYKFKTGTGLFGWGGKHRATLMVSGGNLGNTNNVRIEHISTANQAIKFMGVPTGDGSHDNASIVYENRSLLGSYYLDPNTNAYGFELTHTGGGFWTGQVVVCNSNAPYTYEWHYSYDGYTYWLATSTSMSSISGLPFNKPTKFVKCLVKDATGVVLYTITRHIVYFWNGLAVAYRNGKTISEVSEIETLDINKLYVYPNPTNKEININVNLNLTENLELKVFDVVGKEVFKKDIIGNLGINKYEINQSLKQGIYYVSLFGQNFSSTQKLIIQ